MVDLTDFHEFEFSFDIGRPFRPFEQLMGVLPAASGQHIPEAFRVREGFALLVKC